MKPESPLPWIFDDVIMTADGKYVIDVGDCNMSDIDAAYVVHTCNAHPRLVEAVRQVMKQYDDPLISLGGTMMNLSDLLYELGELGK